MHVQILDSHFPSSVKNNFPAIWTSAPVDSSNFNTEDKIVDLRDGRLASTIYFDDHLIVNYIFGYIVDSLEKSVYYSTFFF